MIDLCQQLLDYSVLMESLISNCQPFQYFIEALRELISSMNQERDFESFASRGRRKLKIDEQHLQFLVEANFRWMLSSYDREAYK